MRDAKRGTWKDNYIGIRRHGGRYGEGGTHTKGHIEDANSKGVEGVAGNPATNGVYINYQFTQPPHHSPHHPRIYKKGSTKPTPLLTGITPQLLLSQPPLLLPFNPPPLGIAVFTQPKTEKKKTGSIESVKLVSNPARTFGCAANHRYSLCSLGLAASLLACSGRDPRCSTKPSRGKGGAARDSFNLCK